MKLQSVKYAKRQYAGQSVVLPVVGKVTFNQDGTVDVPDDEVDELLIATQDSFNFQPAQEEDQDPSTNKKINTGKPKPSAEDPALTQLKADLEQADTKTLLELAADMPTLKDKAAAMSDGKLRKEIVKALYVKS